MHCYAGIDIGAVSATAAVVADRAVAKFAGGWRASPDCGDDAARVWLSPYRRTRGRPLSAACELLEDVVSSVGPDNIAGVCLTGSGSALAAGKLDTHVVNEFQAIAAGLWRMGVAARTVFEMGGETSKYLLLSAVERGAVPGIVDYATNGDCAAGTGSFLDQQAGRLKYAIEDVGEVVLGAGRAARVAGRCSVFAKSDMIHAQQKGYSPPEVLGGLCDAVARNFRAAVVRSHPVEAPVALVGGVAHNAAVVRALRETFALADDLIVPDACAHVGAVGAAETALRLGPRRPDLSRLSDLRVSGDTSGRDFPTAPPLTMDNVVLLRDRVEDYRAETPGTIDAYLGVDVGSVSTNLAVIDPSGRVIAEIYTPTLGRPIEVTTEALAEIAAGWAHRLNVRGVGTTGSGRELIGQLIGADTINDEITAHKTGATFIGRTMLDGAVPDTIFELGGQDAKYISLQDGVVVDFTMNDACAAGTGSFLEERAEELDVAIKDEFARLALSSRAPIRLGERCTVFMERDVNSYLQRGAATADLVAGLARSVVHNYINRVVRGRPIGECIFLQGGTAYNDAVAAAFAAITGKRIIVPPHNGVIGAIGAALLARDKMLAGGRGRGRTVRRVARGAGAAASRFRGYDLSKVHYTLREFTCKGCSNACEVQEFDVEGTKTYWGDKCSDRYRKRAKAEIEPVIEDLPAMRERLLLDDPDLPEPPPDAPTVGIPMTMFAYEHLPFWRTLLAHLGFGTVLSDPTNRKIVQAGLDAVVAEPCFPIIAAHGHVASLDRDGVDYILLPNVVSLETPWADTELYLCPWHQTLPFVCRRAPALRRCAEKFLTPRVYFHEGPQSVARQLAAFFKTMGIAKRKVRDAVAAAYRAQRSFRTELLAAGREAIQTLRRTGRPGIVLVGRPYNIHDPGMNLSVAYKLRKFYGVNVVPLDFLPTDEVDITDVNDNMYWVLGRRVLAAAKIVAENPNLHIICITNFKCGPDSFIRHFIRPASGKPHLTLQFDGHTSDAGIMTRCEAYLDSKGILRPWSAPQRAGETATVDANS